MKTRAEIENAIKKISAQYAIAIAEGNHRSAVNARMVVSALKWAICDEDDHGFGRMVHAMATVDRAQRQ